MSGFWSQMHFPQIFDDLMHADFREFNDKVHVNFRQFCGNLRAFNLWRSAGTAFSIYLKSAESASSACEKGNSAIVSSIILTICVLERFPILPSCVCLTSVE